MKSTWTEQATNETFPEPITYTVGTTVTLTNYQNDDSYTVTESSSGNDTVYNIEFTKDTPAYRLTKFRAEAPQYMEIESATFYYLFTLFFLMIDSRAKNMFIGFHGSETTGLEYIDRKVVFEPYDMDTAIGTNNSGVLKFGYYHLDTDTVSSIISGGEDGGTEAPVYNGQGSVLWNNFREAFRAEWTSMYRTLRSTGWSYETVERIYEEHQSMWPEALFNEDAYVKYLTPLVENVTWDEETKKYIKTDRYLTMLQGSKEQQRKWWLQNRFRYMDSMVTTGNAETSFIEMRLFNSGTLTVTMSTDGYAAVRFGRGSTTQRVRTTANTPVSFNYTVRQGMTVTEMESTIFSANLVSDVGDLSGFYGNEFDFSKATRLRKLKLGDASPSYNNANLQVLNVSNCYLLEEIDCRNCNALTQPINLEGSAMLEKAYFDGTKITSISLVEGAPITNLHLPGTIVSLVLMDHAKLTDFQCPSLENVSTLMVKNIPQNVFDPLEALQEIKEGSRINVQGIYMEIIPESGDQTVTVPVYDENDNQTGTTQVVLKTDAEKAGYEIEQFLDTLKTMKGVERARNTDGEWDYQTIETGAIISGEIHTRALTGEQIERYNSKYPYLRFTAENVSSKITFKNWDGSNIGPNGTVVECLNGVMQGNAPSGPARTSTAQYDYTFVGWSRNEDAQTAQADALTNVIADRTVYAAYSRTVRKYTVTWKNADGTVVETDNNVNYGTKPTYNGSALTFHGQTQTGWDRSLTEGITGDTVITAVYKPMYTVTFKTSTADGNQTLQTLTYVVEGTTPSYTGETPTTTQGTTEEFTFTGWTPAIGPIYADTTYTAVFRDNRSVTLKYLLGTLDEFESDTLTEVGVNAFSGQNKLTTFKAPVTQIGSSAFYGCTNLDAIILTDTDTVVPLVDTQTLGGTKIASYYGAVYVDANLVEQYKADANWSNYIILPISAYPATGFDGTRLAFESWSNIIAAGNDGSYKDKYRIGDLKALDMGTYGTHNMQLVGIEADTNATSNASVPMTWISQDLVAKHNMNDEATTANGWEGSGMRTWLNSDFKAQLPSAVASAIIPVTKYSSTYGSAVVKDGQTTTDTLWIPSNHEMGYGTTYETQGPVYSGVFTSTNSTKVKKYNNSSTVYWNRSVYSATNFGATSTSGSATSSNASVNTYGVALGFCLGTYDQFENSYAVEWNYNQTSPALTRKGLAASFTDPVPATSNEGTGSSPFDSIMPWAGMEVYNIMPDGTKIKKGASGFSFTDNDTMVYIPEFYYMAQKNEAVGKWTWAISPTAQQGFTKHPGSGRYVGRYHTTGTSAAVGCKSGVNPLVNTTQTNFRTYHKNKGDGWYMLDFASWSAIQMLYLVEFANFDSQTMLGGGWNTGSITTVGGTDSATYCTVKATGAHNQYRWIEDPFSNVLDWIDGFIGSTSAIYVGTDNDAFDGTTATLSKVGSLKLPSTNEISNFGYDDAASWAFIPSASVKNSNYNTYTCDYVSSLSSASPCYVGGGYSAFAGYGLFCLFCYTASSSYGNVGSRPLFIS